MKIVEKFRKTFPDFNFTTDLIVGFPGESQEDFQETVKIAGEIGFSHIHTFKYSVRQGTRAERMPDQIPEKIKNQRSAVIRDISEANKIAYHQKFIGQSQRVLIEKINAKGIAKGYGEHYIPVEFKAADSSKNSFVDVNISDSRKTPEPVLIGNISVK
jgi:threonylcarbamoyladenosine tRNA methylthiotransferase MtaB